MIKHYCPNDNTELELVEGEVAAAHQAWNPSEGTYIEDEKWGFWYECPKCHFQADEGELFDTIDVGDEDHMDIVQVSNFPNKDIPHMEAEIL